MCHSAVTLRVPSSGGGGSRKSWRSSAVISRSWVERNTSSIARMIAAVRPSEPFSREAFLLLFPALLTDTSLWAALSRARRDAEKVAVLLCHFFSVRSPEDQLHALDQRIWSYSEILDISTVLMRGLRFRHRRGYLL